MTHSKTLAQIATILEHLYGEQFETPATSVIPLAVSGSDRRYFRISGNGPTVIGTYNANNAENNTFFYVTELFRKNQVNVPEIYKISKDRKSYLQQDLGTTSLFDLVLSEGFTDRVRKIYHTALTQLARAHWVAGIRKTRKDLTGKRS